MPEIRGITVSVGYASELAVTLVRNMRHFAECVVVTAPEDEATREVARDVPGVRLHVTDAHRRHGARFNKGLCMHEGFEVLGKHGWIWIFDSDILFPDSIPLDMLRPNVLHGARRRILEDPAHWRPDLDWRRLPLHPDGGPVGHTQIFHADAPALRGKAVWYDVSFGHAGGGDAAFMGHWPQSNRVVLPFEVLHLGVPDRNWFGTDPEGRDLMAAFVHRNGWRRAMSRSDPTATQRVGEIVERVDVPGHGISDFELPFVRRARQGRDRRPHRQGPR